MRTTYRSHPTKETIADLTTTLKTKYYRVRRADRRVDRRADRRAVKAVGVERIAIIY